MADPKNILPGMMTQNPAPFTADSQDRKTAVRSQVDRIVATLIKSLPSNYVSQVQGPFYTMQLQAVAEVIADFQVTAQEIFADSSYDFTRSEVLFQILGSLVFPDANTTNGWPTIDGDVSYRTFLQRMVALLLQGSTKNSIQGGIEALTNASVQVIERAVAARQLKGDHSAWGPGDQFTFEVNVTGSRTFPVVGETHTITSSLTFPLDELSIDPTTVRIWSLDRLTEYYGSYSYGITRDFSLIPEDEAAHLTVELTEDSRLVSGVSVLVDYTRSIDDFAKNPYTLQKNVAIVMRALKPAHTLYDYRNLFHEVFSPLVKDEIVQQFDLSLFKYEDERKYWLGVHAITSLSGETLIDRSLFRDTSRDFSGVPAGSTLSILAGANTGNYTVKEVRVFPVGDDPIPRPYTTSPTGLSGYLTVSGSDVTDLDPTHDFSTVVEDEILTITSGPNAGSYRIYALGGLDGGVLGRFTPPVGAQYLTVRLATSLIRINGWMPQALASQSYRVGVDRLGAQDPHSEIHEDASAFFCGTSGTRDVLYTRKGPLVKAWGDETPATVKDVHVYVGAAQVEVTVAEVNPYTGMIRLTNPILVHLPGDPNGLITVSYWWIATPIMEMSGLNTPGLVLNKWDRNGRAPRGGNFPMAVVLGPRHRPDPLQIGWRYIGFERDASSLLNAPTTLTLNQSPNRDAVPAFILPMARSVKTYEATQSPIDAGWNLLGTDSGHLVTSGTFVGTYVLEDSKSGVYDPASNGVLFVTKYSQAVDPIPQVLVGATTTIATRFQIETSTSLLDSRIANILQLDGVFTGVGFGYKIGAAFGLVGAVVVNGLQHIGFLTDIERPDLEASWILGPYATGTIQLASRPDMPVNQIRFQTTDIPSSLVAGNRFQIQSGLQAGVYTVSSIVRHTDRTTVLTVTPAFPASPRVNGGKYPVAVFETPWSGDPSTYRLRYNSASEEINLWMSGTIAMPPATDMPDGRPILTLNVSSAWNLDPADSPIFGSETPEIFWGSLSFNAKNRSRWSFFRQGVSPATPNFRAHSISEAPTTSGSLPEDPWFEGTKFGNAVSIGSKLLVKSSVGSSSVPPQYDSPLGFSYDKVEPFLTRQGAIDLNFGFSQDFGETLVGAIDPEASIWFGSLLYLEKVTAGKPYRRIVKLPSTGFFGGTLPSDEGWWGWNNTVITGTTVTQLSGQEILHSANIPTAMTIVGTKTTQEGRTFHTTFQVNAVTHSADGMTSIFCGADMASDIQDSANQASVRLRFKDSVVTPPNPADRSILVTTLSGTVLRELPFDWNDGLSHDVSIVGNGTGAIRVLIDHQMIGPMIQVSECLGHAGSFLQDHCVFGTLADPDWKSIVQWSNVQYGATAVSEVVGSDVRITQAANQFADNRHVLDNSDYDAVDDGGRVFEANLAIQSASLVGNLTSIAFVADIAPTTGHVQVRFGNSGTPFVALTDITKTIIQSYPFDWTDGKHHSYQVRVTGGGTVSLLIDEVLQTPTLNVAQFPGRVGGAQDVCFFGNFANPGWTSVVYWHSVKSTYLPSSELKYTVGISKTNPGSADYTDIDYWEIPRADSSTSPNSSHDPAVDVRQVDWRTSKTFRIMRTPEWGATVYIPSLGSPPWHVGVRQGWVNPKSEPSAGWINVEYSALPKSNNTLGSVTFGAKGVTQQRWDSLNYRLFKPLDPNYIAPPNMVLNRANVLTSGDLGKDTTNEIVTIPAMDKRRVSLLPTHIYAASVYKIIDGSNIITRESWDFDQKAQLITLKDPVYQPSGGTSEFSSEHANLTVVYIPGAPVTETYLAKQALLESAILLNEGTPIFQQSQYGKSTLAIKQSAIASSLTQVDLHQTGNPAATVVKIEDGFVTWTSNDFVYDPGTQIVTLNAGNTFTSTTAALIVWFTPVAVNLENGDPTAVHVDPVNTRFRDLKFITVDNGGTTGLIAPVSECTLPVGQSGFIAGEGGDKIYSLAGVGPSLGGVGPCAGLRDTLTTIGSPVGSMVFDFKGSLFNEILHPVSSTNVFFDLRWGSGAGVPPGTPPGTIITQWHKVINRPTMQLVSGNILFASGGVADSGGTLNDVALF